MLGCKNPSKKGNMIKFDKLKKHQELVAENLKDKTSESAVFDGYEIHDQLVAWAMLNISTKKLKELIKRS